MKVDVVKKALAFCYSSLALLMGVVGFEGEWGRPEWQLYADWMMLTMSSIVTDLSPLMSTVNPANAAFVCLDPCVKCD